MIYHRFLIAWEIFLLLLAFDSVAAHQKHPESEPQQRLQLKGTAQTARHRVDSSATAAGSYVSEFAVQIGAFALKENAQHLREQFASEGYRVDIYENFLDGKNLLYLVWVGSYPTREEAERVLDTIRTTHEINGILRTRTAWRK